MTPHTELLARYKHLRRVAMTLSNRLVATLSRSVMDEGGKKLGILDGDVLTLDTEDELAVLMDYCLHDVRRNGLTAIEVFLASSPPAPESDEWILLQALRRSRYALVAVEAVEPGVGVHVRDLLRDGTQFLVDVGFSQSASIGMVLATRITAPDGIGMTTGAPLPVGVLSPTARASLVQSLKDYFKGMDFHNLSPEEASEFAGTIIRTILSNGGAERVAYADPGQNARRLGSARPPAALPAHHIGRNDPCPCGSGKKFKRCCGAGRA